MKNNRLFMVMTFIIVMLFLSTSILAVKYYGIALPFSDSEYDYHSNPQYDADLSMFEMNPERADIVFAGDSLTARCHFDELLDTDKTILNRGIGSDTTEGLYNRLDEILSHDPSKIFIMIGINDVGLDIPQDDTIHYYEAILDRIKEQNPKISVYVQSVLPTTEYDNDQVRDLNASIEQLTEQYNYNYVDINQLFYKDGELITEYYSSDGVHINGAGYDVWLKEIAPLIN